MNCHFFLLATSLLISALLVLLSLLKEESLLMLTQADIGSRKDPHTSSTRSRQSIKDDSLDHKGSWIGNTWIPPTGWRYYSVDELKDFYKNKTVLWIGDSTARRASRTFYGMINSTAPHVPVQAIDDSSIIDVNKLRLTDVCPRFANHSIHGIVCHPMPLSNNTADYMYVPLMCFKKVLEFLEKEVQSPAVTTNVDIIVIALGQWEVTRPSECKIPNRTLLDIQCDVIQMLAQRISSNITVVWRTTGYSSDKSRTRVTRNVNDRAKYCIQQEHQTLATASNLLLVDWAAAIEPRCFDDERIAGDIKPHHGLEPRVVLTQMITNKLRDHFSNANRL